MATIEKAHATWIGGKATGKMQLEIAGLASSHLKQAAAAFLLASILGACRWLEISVPPGEVLFQDNFSHSASGWDRYQDATYVADYVDDGYHIRVSQPDTDAWSTPNLEFDNVRIEVDAAKVAGPDDNVYGILCRYQGPEDYYFFMISSDGYAGIGVNKDGRRQLLSGDSMLPSEAVRRGEAPNHLRADCIGYVLALYVNGVQIAEVRAAEWSRGDVGIIAGTYETPGAEIRFDNFSVVQP